MEGRLIDAVAPAESQGFAGLLLAVGCGHDDLKKWKDSGYACIRLDIDPATNPDIVGNMVDLSQLSAELYQVVFCSHSLEHLYPHEVGRALAEFHRVLKPGGRVIVLVPDLQDVPATDDKLPGTDICGLHLYYGDASEIEAHPYMAHHCGFVESTLKAAMEAAGFKVRMQRMSHYNLMGIGIK